MFISAGQSSKTTEACSLLTALRTMLWEYQFQCSLFAAAFYGGCQTGGGGRGGTNLSFLRCSHDSARANGRPMNSRITFWTSANTGAT